MSPTKHSDLTPRRGEEDETKNTHTKSVQKKEEKKKEATLPNAFSVSMPLPNDV